MEEAWADAVRVSAVSYTHLDVYKRQLGGNDGQMIFFGKHPHAIDVVRMLVGEQNSLNRQRVNPAGAQHVVQLPRTAAGVEQ